MATATPENDVHTSEEDWHLIADRYRAHDRIGRGRLGEIFAATDTGYEKIGVEQRLAIQVIPEIIVGNNKLFNKINQGYSQLRSNNHPNIVDFMRFGRDGKFGYLAMELLDGASLRQVLDNAETLPMAEVRPVIRGIGEALRFLHAKDIVHGNLASQSIFITDEFEVRLLDVLPVDPAEAIVRGITSSDPFGRCTVQDDVFGLACLAYEMLSGKHAFNYSSPAEARKANLEVDRIDGLADREWEALRRALSCDDGQKPSSVADFMDDFGIQGTERIQPPMEQPAPPKRDNLTVAPVAARDSVLVIEKRPSNATRMQKRNHPLRAAFLGMVLAGLGAWWYFGQPEEHMVNWISYFDGKMAIGLVEPGDGIIDISATGSEPISLTERVTPVDQAVDATPEAIVQATQQIPEARSVEQEITPMIEESVAAEEQPAIQSAQVVATDDGSAIDPDNEETISAADDITADTDVTQAATNYEVAVTEFIVSVTERDGAARITVPPIEQSDTSLIWWTSEHTATADEDYISIANQTLDVTSFGESSTLHVPLVNDSLAEPQESFFVNIGRLNARQGQIERISTTRVDIVDDDLR